MPRYDVQFRLDTRAALARCIFPTRCLKILITGGFEFVGTQLAFHFQHRGHQVIAADNLVCRGSELNLPRFKRHGIEFVNVDVRHPEDLATLPKGIDLIRDASAQPSVV